MGSGLEADLLGKLGRLGNCCCLYTGCACKKVSLEKRERGRYVAAHFVVEGGYKYSFNYKAELLLENIRHIGSHAVWKPSIESK
jgi:hypothetical protein